MKTYTVVVNIWNDEFTDTFQGTTEIKAESPSEALRIAEKSEWVRSAVEVLENNYSTRQRYLGKIW